MVPLSSWSLEKTYKKVYSVKVFYGFYMKVQNDGRMVGPIPSTTRGFETFKKVISVSYLQ